MVQILVHSAAQLLHAVKIPARLDVVRQIDDLLQPGHVRLAGSVIPDGIVHRVLHAEHTAGNGGTGLAVQQLQGLPLQFVQLDAVLRAQRQLLRHIQFLRAVVEQRRDAGLVLVAAVAADKTHRLLLRAQYMGHPLGLQIAQGDGPQLIRRQSCQRHVRTVQLFPQYIAVYGGGQQIRAAALGQRLPHLCGGQLHHLRIGDNGHVRAVLPLQKRLLPGKGGLLAALHAAERADAGHGHHLPRLPPVLQGQEHVRAHQQENFIIRILLLHHAQRFPGIAGAAAPQLHIQHLGFFAQRRRGQHRHVQPLLRRCRPRRQFLVGRDKRGDQQQLIQRKPLHGGLCRRDVPVVGRVERPAVNADLQFFSPAFTGIFSQNMRQLAGRFAFTSSIFRLLLSCCIR